jgi:hypothetical protein
MKDSKSTQAIRLAYQKGYHVLPGGEVETASGKIRKLSARHCSKPVYLRFNIRLSDCRATRPVMVHQLAAYQKFGEAAYMAAECVRHLNGDSHDNRLDNIELGTLSDNSMDRPEADRRAHAAKASAVNQRKDWDLIDADRSEGMGYASLARKYGISRGTLSYRYSKTGKRRRLLLR